MRKKLILIFAPLLMLLSACTTKQEFKTLSNLIEYDTRIKTPDPQLDWWIMNLEGPKREEFINTLIEHIEKGILTSYDQEMKKINFAELREKLVYYDTLTFLEEGTDSLTKTLVKHQLEDFNTLFFRESWTYNPESMLIQKDIHAYGLGETNTNSLVLNNPLFWVIPDSATAFNKKNKSEVTSKIVYDVIIQNKEDDASWFKNNIEKSSRINYCSKLLDKVKNKDLKAYDILTLNEIPHKKIMDILERTDSIMQQKVEPPYEWVTNVVTTKVEPENIVKIRFMESWYLDKKSMQFQKMIHAIAPLQEKYSESGQFRGYQPLFWIFFDTAFINK